MNATTTTVKLKIDLTDERFFRCVRKTAIIDLSIQHQGIINFMRSLLPSTTVVR
ncbi:hypothetical protein [Nostoc sp. UHCC 0252]|uniref:hypothetical protein n=1 Tax=Nostoc sp. UHCC 0252 TaxID=3110241 RepID=UPI002B20805A|nr:hypothetical protein [Nostoc sp. UHCC 0252]MEA5601178.1 hypothetical protein [Nostoc sp. UHCC 0252]